MLSLQIELISTDLRLPLNQEVNNKKYKNNFLSDFFCFLFPKTHLRVTRMMSFQHALKSESPNLDLWSNP